MKDNKQNKYSLPVVTAEMFGLEPSRYILKKGTSKDAPLCPYGHHFTWIGYDLKLTKYVRVTKSVFKNLIRTLDQESVERHERNFMTN